MRTTRPEILCLVSNPPAAVICNGKSPGAYQPRRRRRHVVLSRDRPRLDPRRHSHLSFLSADQVVSQKKRGNLCGLVEYSETQGIMRIRSSMLMVITGAAIATAMITHAVAPQTGANGVE